MSKTGKSCKPWIEHSSVYKFTHNYCRNFGGENIAPWCFVDGGKKEFCRIPKCEQPSTGKIFSLRQVLNSDLNIYIYLYM